MSRKLPAALIAAVAIAVSRESAAQGTLRDALREADSAAYANRIAAGTAAATAAQALSPLKGILPSARVDGGYLRTTDPLSAFGARLRARDVSQASFDPARLNYPDALISYQGALVLEQPLINVDAWLGRRALKRVAQSSRSEQKWTTITTRADVVRAFYGVVLASEKVRTLEAATVAARAHLKQAEALVRQGLVTRSDALLASVRAGDMDVQLAEANGGVSNARRQLAVLLGRDPDTMNSGDETPATLPSADAIRAAVAADTLLAERGERADVDAAQRGFEAASADALRARSQYLPRINSFARYDWSSPSRPFGGEKSWTVGVMASWSPFAGASDVADLRSRAARRDAAKAQLEAAQAKARIESAEARTALIVALTRLSIAERAVSQSAEAHRIVGRKYAGGLASVTELLDAQATETQSALALSAAEWGAIAAAAEVRRASGRDPASLEILDTRKATDASVAAPDTNNQTTHPNRFTGTSR